MSPGFIASIVAVSVSVAQLWGCSPHPGPARSASAPTLPSDAVFEVLQAAGRTYVIQGQAAEPPTVRGAVSVLAQGRTLEVVTGDVIEPPLSFTLVGPRGSCTTTASLSAKVGFDSGWRDAIALDGCRTDPTEQRLALVGEVADARWLPPEELLEADSEAVPTSEFFEGNLSGKSMHRRRSFPGLGLSFEQRWLAPAVEPTATRILEGSKVLSAFVGDVEGAVRAGSRWLFVVRHGADRSVLELSANQLLPRLGNPPPPAPTTQPPLTTTSASSALPSALDLGAISGSASASPKPQLSSAPVVVRNIQRTGAELTITVETPRDESLTLELSLPPALPLPLAVGQRLVLSVRAKATAKERAGVFCFAEDGRLLLAIGTGPGTGHGISVREGGALAPESGGGERGHSVELTFAARTLTLTDRWTALDGDAGRFAAWGVSRAPSPQRPRALSYALVRID